MNDDPDEYDGLIDKDPALDFILYQEMEREDKQPGNKSGCFSVMLLFILPMGNFLYFLATL